MKSCERLTELRKSVGCNLREFGMLLGVTDQCVAHMESGRSPIKLGHIERLCGYGFNALMYLAGQSPDPLAQPYDTVRDRIRNIIRGRAA